MSSVQPRHLHTLLPWKDTCSRRETYASLPDWILNWKNTSRREDSSVKMADSTTALQIWGGTETLSDQDCWKSAEDLGGFPSLLAPGARSCLPKDTEVRMLQMACYGGHRHEQSGSNPGLGPLVLLHQESSRSHIGICLEWVLMPGEERCRRSAGDPSLRALWAVTQWSSGQWGFPQVGTFRLIIHIQKGLYE